MDKKVVIGMIIAIAMLFYIGTTMFYNTGLGITDLNVEEKTDSNTTQYELFYMLRSVRSFEYIDCQYTLLSDSGQEIATGSTTMINITDGTFNINETLNNTNNDSSQKAKEIQIRIFTEKFDPEQKNPDGTPKQSVFFEQTFPLNN